MGKHRTLHTCGEVIMIYDSPQEISMCLSCTIPASKCAGIGHCNMDTIAKTRYGSRAQEIREYVRAGMKRSEIARLVNCDTHTVSSYIRTDVKRGVLTQEEADRSRSYRYTS